MADEVETMYCGLCFFRGSPASLSSHLRVRCGWSSTAYCSDGVHMPRTHSLLHFTASQGLDESWVSCLQSAAHAAVVMKDWSPSEPCAKCGILCNSPTQLRQHLHGTKHQERLAWLRDHQPSNTLAGTHPHPLLAAALHAPRPCRACRCTCIIRATVP